MARARAVQLAERHDLEITWLAYEIHPEVPAEGIEVRSGFDRVAALAEAEGIRFVSPKRLRNSAKAHQAALAVEHADPDAAERYHDRLYAAYWEDELDVTDPKVLVTLAADVAIDPDVLRRVVANDELLPALRASMARANEWGISATPSWLFDGRLVIPGAQDDDFMADVIRRLRERPAPGTS
ncbi:DsbA family oxidoreductase [Candidatus Poriferisodalis sp.]|uniref:DsbA family oxidoreductase n=1 Tax=Candidatus Poriferisodalis sp. TaxID=3101277 RepID=UPI003B590CB4